MEICQVHEIFYSGLKLSDLVSSHLNAKISENTRARVLTRLHYVAWGTTADPAPVVFAGRQKDSIILNSEWKCNQKIMKESQVFVRINLHSASILSSCALL